MRSERRGLTEVEQGLHTCLPACQVFYFSGLQLGSCEKIGAEERGVKGQIVNIFSSVNITFQLSIIREDVIDTMETKGSDYSKSACFQ